MKIKKIIALLLSMSMLSGMSVGSFADDGLTIGESQENEVSYDVFDLETGEEYQIKAESFYEEGEEITVPAQAAVGNDEMIPFSEKEMADMQNYFAEHASSTVPYGYDESWSKVSNTSVEPYRSIARIRITWSDGSIEYGTGVAVGDGVVLTAAHCLYDPEERKSAQRLDLYFGQNGNYYYKSATGKQYYLPSGWKDLSDYELTMDYGAILIDKSVTKAVGTLSYSTVIPTTSDMLTLTGYPWVKGSSKYNALNCYKDTGKITGFYTGKLAYKHDMNCTIGDSGAPVYKDYGNSYAYGDDYVVCGIHSGDFKEYESSGAAKTIDSKVLNMIRTAENAA